MTVDFIARLSASMFELDTRRVPPCIDPEKSYTSAANGSRLSLRFPPGAANTDDSAQGALRHMAEKPQAVVAPPAAVPTSALAPGAQSPPAIRRGPGHRGTDMRDAMAELTERAHLISRETGSKVGIAIRDVISAAAGLSGFAIESARDILQYMVRRSQMTQDEADRLIRDAEHAHSKRPASERNRPTATKIAAERAAAAKAEAAARAAAAAAAAAPYPAPAPVALKTPLARGKNGTPPSVSKSSASVPAKKGKVKPSAPNKASRPKAPAKPAKKAASNAAKKPAAGKRSVSPAKKKGKR